MSIFNGRGWPAPGEPFFTPADRAAALALAEEEADTCRQCGMPRSWCRDNATGRARFDVNEEFCWATYRVALRQEKQLKEKVAPAMRAGYVHTPRFNDGHEPDVMAGLEAD